MLRDLQVYSYQKRVVGQFTIYLNEKFKLPDEKKVAASRPNNTDNVGVDGELSPTRIQEYVKNKILDSNHMPERIVQIEWEYSDETVGEALIADDKIVSADLIVDGHQKQVSTFWLLISFLTKEMDDCQKYYETMKASHQSTVKMLLALGDD